MKCLKQYLTQCVIFLLVAIVIFGGMWLLTRIVKAPIVIEEAQGRELSIDNQKVEVVKRDDIDRLIDRLAECESNNNPNAINPADPDTASRGLLQFKDGTFHHFAIKYAVLPDLELLEVDNVIFDGNIQRRIAKEMIKDGLWYHWKNCLSPYFT